MATDFRYASLAGLLPTPTQQTTPSYLSLDALAPSVHRAPPKWIAVRQRFTQFEANLRLTLLQSLDGYGKRGGVVNCLNRHYYDSTSETDHSFLIGSWGKDTAVRPPRDVDTHFVLPSAVYHRFQTYLWNRQSALLQEVKGVLSLTYPDTDMSGDGQIVLVKFDSFNVEVVPAFQLENGGYWICNTDQGGCYKWTNPWSEAAYIDASDKAVNGNLRRLIRILKAWQTNCGVPIKSFQLELIAAEFIAQSPWRQYDYFWFDWITRDFFVYLYHRANGYVTIPGSAEIVALGDEWRSRCQSAYARAVKACDFEEWNLIQDAGDEWQKIFGTQIPRDIS
jgi:hypothetical protein